MYYRFLFLSFCLMVLLSCQTVKQTTPQQYAISTAHPSATQAGQTILEQGGNAFDAAIAIAATLGVTEPFGSGLGGGGFWLLYRAQTKSTHFIDARETAPAAATTALFETNGTHDRDKALNGATAPGIPGQAAAFDYVRHQYGSLPLKQTLKPAIDAADNGFAINETYRRLLKWRLPIMQQYPQTRQQFLYQNKVPPLGYRLKQTDLAKTLSRVASQGRKGFYQGETARKMVKSVQDNGGVWTLSDLKNYQVKERTPIVTNYKHHKIISAPPPSAGGILLANMLNMLEPFELETLTPEQEVHLLTEVMRRAYQQRAQHLGDPDFISIPTERLLSKTFARQQMQSFDEKTAGTSNNGTPVKQGTHTTHFSVLDTQGNMASVTLSINLPFGSGFVAEGTGVILNNELDDFNIDLNGSNAYGLTGNQANALEPHKRPLSSMTPTFIFSKDSVAILGTPGGSRITSMVLLGALEAMQDKPVHQWVSRKRFHHQYLPDEIQFEKNALDLTLQNRLKQKGHQLKEKNRQYGNMQAVHWHKAQRTVTAASDPRGEGLAVTGRLNP